jgi:hypothetical protein
MDEMRDNTQRNRERELMGFFGGLWGMVSLVALLIIVGAALFIWVI